MVREFKKIISVAFVFVTLLLGFPVKAEKFYRTPEFEEKIAISVGKSGIVKEKSAKEKSKKKGRRGAGDKVCEDRLKLLYNICERSGTITDRQVSGIVGMYLREAHLNPNTLEGQQLRKSRSADDLLHNVGVLIAIYEDLIGKVVL